MTPLFSIIVPVYNVAAFLERCIRSLTGPCSHPIEIILVDDGSTDDSGSLCDALATEDSRIKVIHKENGGLASARNAGVPAATGEYLMFVDSDDYMMPGALDTLAAPVLETRPDMLRFGYRRVMNGQVTETVSLPYPEGLYEGTSLPDIQRDTIYYRHTLDYGTPRLLSAWAAVFRRSWYEESALYFVSEREILNEDYLFSLRALWSAKRFCVCHAPLYCYDMRPNSLSTVYRTEMMARKKRLFAAYCRSVPADDPEVARRLDNFYIDCVYDCMTNEATCPRPAAASIAAIRTLLEDDRLQEALARNKDLAVTKKTKIICYLMRHRLAAAMYWGYRWSKKILAGRSA